MSTSTLKKTAFDIGSGVVANLPMLIDTRLLVQANSGAGKSWAVRRLLEQTFGKVQHLVIDPEGEYATLRDRYDYVLAGKDGETPAEPRSAKLLATRLLELKASAILDLYELRMTDRIQFVRDFLDTLVNAPKHLWHPVMVVIDEAHIFCPQAKVDDDVSSASAVKDLCTRGRKRGFCAVLATQRLSKLHKDAAAECNNKLIGRSSMDVDMKRAADELGFSGRDEMLTLRRLKPGEFYTFGPAISNEVIKVHVGPVLTRHPKAGSRRHFKAPPPTKHIQALLPKLADLPAEVSEHEQTLADKNRMIVDLRRQIRESEHKAKSVPPTIVEVPVLKGRELEKVEKIAGKLKPVVQSMAAAAKVFDVAVTNLVTALLSATKSAKQQPQIAPPPGVSPLKARLNKLSSGLATTAPPVPMSKGPKKTLIALAQHEDGIGREQLTAVTGYARSTRDQYVRWLEGQGFATISGLTVTITDAGIAALGRDFQPLPTGDELRNHWFAKLPAGEVRILQLVSASYPEGLTKPEIAQGSGFARSTLDQYLRSVMRLKIVALADGKFYASSKLFG